MLYLNCFEEDQPSDPWYCHEDELPECEEGAHTAIVWHLIELPDGKEWFCQEACPWGEETVDPRTGLTGMEPSFNEDLPF